MKIIYKVELHSIHSDSTITSYHETLKSIKVYLEKTYTTLRNENDLKTIQTINDKFESKMQQAKKDKKDLATISFNLRLVIPGKTELIILRIIPVELQNADVAENLILPKNFEEIVTGRKSNKEIQEFKENTYLDSISKTEKNKLIKELKERIPVYKYIKDFYSKNPQYAISENETIIESYPIPTGELNYLDVYNIITQKILNIEFDEKIDTLTAIVELNNIIKSWNIFIVEKGNKKGVCYAIEKI